jgi:hypothetical protein
MAFIKLLQNVGYQRIDEAIHKIINQWDWIIRNAQTNAIFNLG